MKCQSLTLLVALAAAALTFLLGASLAERHGHDPFFGLIAGLLLFSTLFSRRLLFPFLILGGTALLIAYAPLVQLADRQQLTSEGALWASRGLVAGGGALGLFGGVQGDGWSHHPGPPPQSAPSLPGATPKSQISPSNPDLVQKGGPWWHRAGW